MSRSPTISRLRRRTSRAPMPTLSIHGIPYSPTICCAVSTCYDAEVAVEHEDEQRSDERGWRDVGDQHGGAEEAAAAEGLIQEERDGQCDRESNKTTAAFGSTSGID